MYKLLSVNGTELHDPEGTYEIFKDDVLVEYEGEDGYKTIEIIRRGVISGKITYAGLTVDMLKIIMNSLSTKTIFVLYDPTIDDVVEVEAKVSNITTKKIHHRDGVSVWSLSFSINEL